MPSFGWAKLGGKTSLFVIVDVGRLENHIIQKPSAYGGGLFSSTVSDPLTSRFSQNIFFNPYRDQLRDAFFGHRHAVQGVGGGHRDLVVGDDDKLRRLRELFEHSHEAADIGVVERRVDFVEDAEGAGFY